MDAPWLQANETSLLEMAMLFNQLVAEPFDGQRKALLPDDDFSFIHKLSTKIKFLG